MSPTTRTARTKPTTSWVKDRVERFKDYFRVKKGGDIVNFCTPWWNRIIILSGKWWFQQVPITNYTARTKPTTTRSKRISI